MERYRPGVKIAEELLTDPKGATMAEVSQATGGPQYNLLRKLESRGYRIRKVKEGRMTRYFAAPPARPSFESTLTSTGQVTVPKPVREKLGLHARSKMRFVIEEDGRVVVTPAYTRLADLAGILGKPRRSMTLEEMDDAIADAVVARYRRAVGRAKR
jgi:antitoxin PrlF